jgi:hypothetical protein
VLGGRVRICRRWRKWRRGGGGEEEEDRGGGSVGLEDVQKEEER